MDDLELKGWKKVYRKDPATEVVDEIFIGPNAQVCPDLLAAFEEYQGRERKNAGQALSYVQELLKLHAVTEIVVPTATDASVATNLQSLQADGQEVAVKTTSNVEAKRLAVTSSSLEDYLFRGDHPLLAGSAGSLNFASLWLVTCAFFWRRE